MTLVFPLHVDLRTEKKKKNQTTKQNKNHNKKTPKKPRKNPKTNKQIQDRADLDRYMIGQSEDFGAFHSTFVLARQS